MKQLLKMKTLAPSTAGEASSKPEPSQYKGGGLYRFAASQRGVTLIEVLAALVLTTLVLGTLFYLVNQTHSSAAQVQTREVVLQQSRDIIQHMVRSARGTMQASQTSSEELWLHGDHDAYVHYTWDRASRQFSVEQRLADDQGQLGSLTSHVFSEHVANMQITVAANGRIELELTMDLPNNQQHTLSTVVYTNESL
ncbi:PilW family protein [Paenibacillus daejeonensis]|uniref:PilW family protein n=1 Tax=Paenibacillus daejeonensis TaxID=135193 RepID=UPI00146BBF06|nr:prepilin-type N-terminal cleavage/methylation domain-containing protein [Paenibacillus daejeonensis]